jgi:hypothetical protein
VRVWLWYRSAQEDNVESIWRYVHNRGGSVRGRLGHDDELGVLHRCHVNFSIGGRNGALGESGRREAESEERCGQHVVLRFLWLSF